MPSLLNIKTAGASPCRIVRNYDYMNMIRHNNIFVDFNCFIPFFQSQ